MTETVFRPARLSEDSTHIMDSEGARVELTDPRVVHVYVTDNHPYTKQLILNTYKQYGVKCRVAGRTSIETMKQARRLCSGRECVPSVAIIGNTLLDISQNREPDEISLYISLDQEGPCQNGAWPLMWESFRRRLGVKNTLFGLQPGPDNKNLGLPRDHLMWSSIWYVVGSLLSEAESSLKVAARDTSSALDIFREAARPIVETVRTKRKIFESAIKDWVEQVAAIPLKGPVHEFPKVLIFGGLNLYFVHYPVTDFFIARGIIPKVVDYAEGVAWILSEPLVRYGMKQGIMSPAEQFALVRGGDSEKMDPEIKKAIRAIESVTYLDRLEERYKKMMSPSGLMFDPHLTYQEICEAGHAFVSTNAFTETTTTVGRYILAAQSGIYDGLINLGSFNCQPAMNAQIVIRPLANKGDVPYAALDVEGPQITTNQQKLLEAISVQAARFRKQKNMG
jgi:predicted nucleotide-binding protein (sugar kinase/HSP70/actin superfamily)